MNAFFFSRSDQNTIPVKRYSMESLFIPLNNVVDHAVRRAIFEQPDCKAFALSSYADAEASGEGQVFTQALKRVEDPKLQRLIEQHQADELRHAALLVARREALGLSEHAIPDALRMIDRLSDAAGGILKSEMTSDADVAAAYTLLYVVEERAMDEFRRASAALRDAGDEETAQLFDVIARDEARHLRYCDAIARRYSADFDGELARMRALERSVYGAQSRAWTWHILSNGLLKLPTALGALVKGMLKVTEWFTLPAMAPV